MIKIVSILVLSVIMQACVANSPSPSSDQSSAQQPKQSISRFSIKEIKKKREAEYAQKLIALKAKAPAEEVEKARKSNSVYLLTYYAGRGGLMKAPGLSESQLKECKCKMVLLDGMGDSIYGENHMRFRLAQRQYASEFNPLMLPYCE